MYKYGRNGVRKIDYGKFRTDLSKKRRSAATRELTKIAYSAPQGIVSLAEGMPNEATFPFSKIAVKLTDGTDFSLEGEELAGALQYIPSQGFPPLLQSIREFQRKAHSPPAWDNREIVIVAGGQDGLSKALEAIIGPGDSIIVQNPFYPGASVVIAPHEAELVAVEQDELGIVPGLLRERLEARVLAGLVAPKLMYVNATGANPTGTVMPLERRKEIYDLACEYDFLILDDDPYHFMYFTEEAPTSFLSLDTECRVIRLDSFSKVLSSGLRLGVITAAKPLVASVELHMQSSHLHASTLSQVILYKLMKSWGYDRLMDHFRTIRSFYRERRNLMVKLAEQHLRGLAEFAVPSAGFFLWLQVPGLRDTWDMVMQRGAGHGVLVAPGAAFMADPAEPCNALRLSFAKASYKEMNLALERLSLLIRDELLRSARILNGNT